MPSLETRYLNLDLKNPIIVASSGLTKSVDKIKACENAGAGAVVVKSLFEEALANEEWGLQEATSFHAEAYDYLRAEIEKQYGPRDYCALLEEAKEKVDIPVIASINCVSSKWWPSFAAEIEAAGADALELNIYPSVYDTAMKSQQVDALYYDVIEQVRAKTKLPLAVKVSSYFSSIPNVADELCRRGAGALVFFNRFTHPDIDIKKIALTTTFNYTVGSEMYTPLRWIAMLAGRVTGDFAATTGIKTGEDIIKFLLAGASAVQIASLFYRQGVEQISPLLDTIESWMEEKGFDRIEDFKARLSFKNTQTPEHYLRAQFIHKVRGVE